MARGQDENLDADAMSPTFTKKRKGGPATVLLIRDLR